MILNHEQYETASAETATEAVGEHPREVAMRGEAPVQTTRRFQKKISWALAAAFIVMMAVLGGATWESYRTSEREAAVFGSVGATAFGQGFCRPARALLPFRFVREICRARSRFLGRCMIVIFNWP
jgi:hypothetical protein